MNLIALKSADLDSIDDTKHEGPTNDDDADHKHKADLELRGNEHRVCPHKGYYVKDVHSSPILQK